MDTSTAVIREKVRVAKKDGGPSFGYSSERTE
jgi:hypothetical protein